MDDGRELYRGVERALKEQMRKAVQKEKEEDKLKEIIRNALTCNPDNAIDKIVRIHCILIENANKELKQLESMVAIKKSAINHVQKRINELVEMGRM